MTTNFQARLRSPTAVRQEFLASTISGRSLVGVDGKVVALAVLEVLEQPLVALGDHIGCLLAAILFNGLSSIS